MVSTTALAGATSATTDPLLSGLSPDDSIRMQSALDFAGEAYAGRVTSSEIGRAHV